MTRNRIWIIAMVTAIVVILGLTTVLGVLPQLKLASVNNAERQSVEATNELEAARLTALTVDRRHASTLRTQLAEANAALPTKPQLSSLLGELNTLEQRYHVKVTGYTGGDAQVFGGATAGGAATAAATSTAATPAPSPSPSATSAATAVAPVTTTSPSGLYEIPVQVQASGSYGDLVDFVGGLQTGPRLFTVDTLSIGGGASTGFTASLSGYVYVLTATVGG